MIVNISSHGARVIARRAGQPHDRLVLTELIGDFHVDAEVVYCQRIDREQCGRWRLDSAQVVWCARRAARQPGALAYLRPCA